MADENKNQDLLIRDAQFRKGLSISYFNALNNAIQLVTANGVRFASEQELLDKVDKYQQIFIEKHNEYYARVIASVGVHFDTKKTIARLKACTTQGELKMVWISLSEDERQDKAIQEVAYALRESFVSEASAA